MLGVLRATSGLGEPLAWTPRAKCCLHAASNSLKAEFALNSIRADSFYDSTVEKYAAQDVEVLSLRQMLNFGRNAWDDPSKILKSARYVQRELPKRLARRLLDLQLLPYIVVTNPHIKKVYNQYYVSFETLRRLPTIRTLEENQEFTQLLRQHLDSHAPMLDSLATGLRECKSKELVGSCLAMDSFFDAMLRSRISRRVIAEQHLHINNKRPAYIGIICTDLDVHDSIDFAVQKTKQVCMETYGTAPDVIVSGDPAVSIPYIPAHLDYMLYELLKNAMRAVVETHRGPAAPLSLSHGHAHPHHLHLHGPASSLRASSPGAPPSPLPPPKLPPLHVRVCGGQGTLTLRISDQGGGIPDDIIDKVWSYGFTTIGRSASSSSSRSTPNGNGGGGGGGSSSGNGGSTVGSGSGSGSGPDVVEGLGSAGHGLQDAMGRGGGAGGGSRFKMAGLGFGLPLSRLYARYFGGDLRLQSIPGYGVDAHLTLRKLEEHEWQERVDEPTSLPLSMAGACR